MGFLKQVYKTSKFYVIKKTIYNDLRVTEIVDYDEAIKSNNDDNTLIKYFKWKCYIAKQSINDQTNVRLLDL